MKKNIQYIGRAGNGGKKYRFNDITLFSIESSIYLVKGAPFLHKLFITLLYTAPITGKRILLDDCPPWSQTIGLFWILCESNL